MRFQRLGGGPAVLLLAVAATVTGLTGCASQPANEPVSTSPFQPTLPGLTGTNLPSGGTPSGSGTAGYNCSRITAGLTALAKDITDELARLKIDPSSQQAYPVQLIVTTQKADVYWAAVDASVPPTVRADSTPILAYWRRLAQATKGVKIKSSSDADLQAAAEQLVSATNSITDATLQARQERVRQAVDGACAPPGSTPGSGSTPSPSPSPSPSTP